MEIKDYKILPDYIKNRGIKYFRLIAAGGTTAKSLIDENVDAIEPTPQSCSDQLMEILPFLNGKMSLYMWTQKPGKFGAQENSNTAMQRFTFILNLMDESQRPAPGITGPGFQAPGSDMFSLYLGEMQRANNLQRELDLVALEKKFGVGAPNKVKDLAMLKGISTLDKLVNHYMGLEPIAAPGVNGPAVAPANEPAPAVKIEPSYKSKTLAQMTKEEKAQLVSDSLNKIGKVLPDYPVILSDLANLAENDPDKLKFAINTLKSLAGL
jgi:hypothetical protein